MSNPEIICPPNAPQLCMRSCPNYARNVAEQTAPTEFDPDEHVILDDSMPGYSPETRRANLREARRRICEINRRNREDLE